MNVRVPKIENYYGMMIRIDESEQLIPDILAWIYADHEAFCTPESHDGSFPNHSNFDLR